MSLVTLYVRRGE